jgi:hypothetical protein
MLKRLWRRWAPNPLDLLLKKAQRDKKESFLLCWNRGLGDIALGLYAMVYRIRECIPEAKICFLTRSDLMEGFSLLEGIDLIECPEWKRKQPFDVKESLLARGRAIEEFDVIIEHPDPTWWVKWQLGTLVPKMRWKEEWDLLASSFGLEMGSYLGVHVQTETSYGYEKNWPIASWKELFKRVHLERGVKIVLFGHAKTPTFDEEGIVDLRGKTSLLEMLSIIKNHCDYLVVPDSGVLSLTYFLDASFPLRIVSLWADPRQGVLKQNVPSPNPELVHLPLLGEEEKISAIAVNHVFEALFEKEQLYV